MNSRLLTALLVVVGLVATSCGSGGGEGLTTEDIDPVERELQNLLIGRADLELSASAGPLVDGVVEVTASVRSLDKTTVVGPTIGFVLSPGVTVADLPLLVDTNAVDPTATLTATSQFNPLSNDPDPTNNTVTVNLTP